jgi:DNA-binding IclR family transcriptional regulator
MLLGGDRPMTKDATARAPDGQREHVPTGVRSLYILDVLAKAGIPMTATDINAELGLPKPTIHRLCKRLEQEGFLTRDIDGRRYIPGWRLRDMARGVVGFSRFTQARQAVLRGLSERVGETCNITLPNDSGMIYLDRVETRWPLRVQLPVGSLVPFHCTATGKLYLSSLPYDRRAKLVRALDLKRHAGNTITDPDALLVELEQIAESGVGRDNEEFVEGMVAAAVPIRDQDGRFVAGLAMHGPTQRLSMEDALDAAGLLHEAAQELSGLLPAVEAAEPPAHSR